MTQITTCLHFKTVLRISCAALLIATLAACGGGGGDGGGGGNGSSGQGLFISGGTWAPNGSFAKATPSGLFQKWFAWLLPDESYAQVANRQPLVNARVVAFRINKNGSIQTSPTSPLGIIAETRTDGSGGFNFMLPEGVGLSSDLIVQVSDTATGSTPTPIGNARSMNAPIVSQGVSINPITEAGVREMLARIQPVAGTLPGIYANNELFTFVSVLDAVSANITGNTMQDVITAVTTQNRALIDDTLNLLDEPGQVDQSTTGGGYALAGYIADAAPNGTMTRLLQTGTITLDGLGGTFQVSVQVQGGSLAESCSNSCTRTFIRTPFSSSESMTGVYLHLPTRSEVFLRTQWGQYIFAKLNSARNIVALPSTFVGPGRSFPLGLLIAMKKGSGVTPADLVGTANFFGLAATLAPSSSPLPGAWVGPFQPSTTTGSIAFSPTVASVTGSEDIIEDQVFCTTPGPGGTGCDVGTNLLRVVDPIALPNLPYSVTADGTLTITNPGQAAIQGAVDSTKTLALLPVPDAGGGALLIASKQAAGLTAASLNGTYHVFVMREVIGRTSRFRTTGYLATATLTNGNLTFSGRAEILDRQESCPSVANCTFQVDRTGIALLNASSTYTVSGATAGITLNFASEFGPFTGAAAPDGSFLYAVSSQNAINDPLLALASERTMAFFLKQ